jgi:hypothetical protein
MQMVSWYTLSKGSALRSLVKIEANDRTPPILWKNNVLLARNALA